jgi:hypothetical protein
VSFDIVFVHGTGVREPAYSKAFSIISQNLKERDGNLRVHKCYWGGEHGTTLALGGLAIPRFDTRRSLDGDLSDEDFTLGLWELLYQDPLFELQILSLRSGKSGPIFAGEALGDELDNHVRTLTPSPILHEMLDQAGMGEFFDKAREIVSKERDYQEAIASAQEPLGEYRLAIARSLVAQVAILVRDTYGEIALSLNADLRDQIVERIVAELGGTEMGIVSWLKDSLSGVVKRVVTNDLQRRRSRISENISGGIGDILMYQARGQKVRDFIRAKIAPLPGSIVLIAHSLGGIACVDLLLEKQPPKVNLLVTIGSQAPLLYELNALVGMEYNPNATLPENFPQWLNIYDKNDFLSYVGDQVFRDRVEDVEVNSRQPFPQSHGAYWTNKTVWDEILRRMVTNP